MTSKTPMSQTSSETSPGGTGFKAIRMISVFSCSVYWRDRLAKVQNSQRDCKTRVLLLIILINGHLYSGPCEPHPTLFNLLLCLWTRWPPGWSLLCRTRTWTLIIHHHGFDFASAADERIGVSINSKTTYRSLVLDELHAVTSAAFI